LGRCFYFLRDYTQATQHFQQIKGPLPATDTYYLAESLAARNDYSRAVDVYNRYLSIDGSHQELILKKIWQLKNARFLFEDSIHFAVRPVSVNSGDSEICPTPYENGIVFLSNRTEVKIVNDVDGTSGASFYRWYYSGTSADSLEMLQFNKPALFNPEFTPKFHAGPVAFYDHDNKAVFAATSTSPGVGGERTLQLYFVSREGGKWKTPDAFSYNSAQYSVSDPSISDDGTVLFFSSDMKGGFGGRDLYKSEYRNGRWTKPVNLGDQVNTPFDERFPFVHQNRVLYFSSNGHAGLGGLDIFKADIGPEGYGEIENAGYPLNTNYDDFSIVFDSLGVHGFLTSNRRPGKNNDDIYEIDMDLQTYPLVIEGVIKFKEHNWTDSSEIKLLPHAKLMLIDNLRNVTVHQSVSDADGNFTIQIPYFSKYKISITSADNEENMVSLEIPKHRKSDSKHEIVVVKDPFTSPGNEIIK
jgi:hypothetical protein